MAYLFSFIQLKHFINLLFQEQAITEILLLHDPLTHDLIRSSNARKEEISLN